MSQAGSWNDRGMDHKAREAARQAALSEGLSLREYLRRMLQGQEGHEDSPSAMYPGEGTGDILPGPRSLPWGGRAQGGAEEAVAALEYLSRRIEAAEARSTQAISGIDRSLLSLVARIDTSEQTTAAVASHVDGLIEQMRSTHEALQAKVRRLEEDESGQQNLEALKTLEAALSRLAGHVYAEAELVQNESQAIRGRMESGLGDLAERMEGFETRVEQKLSQAVSRLEQRTAESEQQARKGHSSQADANRQLLEGLERLTNAVPRQIEARLSAAKEALSSQLLSSMERNLSQVQERLSLAEQATDAALRNLEASFASLDQRIGAIALKAGPDMAERLRDEFETRFDDITQLVRSAVQGAREEMADEINTVRSDLSHLSERLADEAGTAGDTRTREMEARLSERIERLSGEVATRLEEGELRNADAIEQVGEQVTVAAIRLQKRQDEALAGLLNRIETGQSQAETRLSEALSDVSERIEEISARSVQSLSPVQRAIAALATRLENLETATPHAEAGRAARQAAPLPARTPAPMNRAGAGDPGTPPHPAGTAPATQASGDAQDKPAAMFSDETPSSRTTSGDLPDFDDPDDEDFEVGLDSWITHNQANETPSTQISARSGSAISPYDHDYGPESTKATPPPAWDQAPAMQPEEAFDDLPDITLAGPLPDETYPEFEDDTYDPFEDVTGLEEARSEARESDIFDSWDEPGTEGHTQAAPAPSPAARLLSDPTADDYMARARHAAIAAAGAAHIARQRPSRVTAKSTGLGRTPIYLAATAVLVGGAGGGSLLYLRGKQPADPPASRRVDTQQPATLALALPEVRPPEAQTPSVQDSFRDAEDELFSDAADMQAIESELFAETPSPGPLARTIEEETAPAQPGVTKLASLIPAPSAGYAPIPAMVTIEAAASAGDGIAQYQLAQDLITRGEITAAIPLLEKAGLNGIAPADYDLGKLFENGLGVGQDLIEARRLINRAAQAGHVGAMYDLALFMAEGEGGEGDPTGAIGWFRKAADHGFTDAQYNLGVIHAEGMGTGRDQAEALYWFELAARQGDSDALAETGRIASRLSAEIVNDTRRRAAAWTPVTPSASANGRFPTQLWDGASPRQIRAVQVALASLGFLDSAPDGILGPRTSAAIGRYQSAEGLPVSGRINADLIDRLNANASAG